MLIFLISEFVSFMVKMAHGLVDFLNTNMNRFGVPSMNFSSTPQLHLLSSERIHADVEGIPTRTSDEQVSISTIPTIY